MHDEQIAFDEWPSGIFNCLKDSISPSNGIATIAARFEQDEPRILYTFNTALVDREELNNLKTDPSFAFETCTSTLPFPSRESAYEPRISLFSMGLPSETEPLAFSWRNGQHVALVPNPELPMTYGLIPRAAPDTGLALWDDPSKPVYGIIENAHSAFHDWPRTTDSYVKVSNDYLIDYANLRHKSVITAFFAIEMIELEAWNKAVGKELEFYQEYSRSLLRARRVAGTNAVRVEAKGYVVHSIPDTFPVSEADINLEPLVWEGIHEPVTPDNCNSFRLTDCVYIKDEVLGLYEDKDEYDILPEYGIVGNRNQWSIGDAQRVCRDLIRVPISSLYMCPPNHTLHWHRHCTGEPAESIEEQNESLNIALRAKALTNACFDLACSIHLALDGIVGNQIAVEGVFKSNQVEADNIGWYKINDVKPLCRHAPLDMTVDDFLSRCLSLNKFIVEGFKPSSLKSLLRATNVSKDALRAGTISLLTEIHLATTAAVKYDFHPINDAHALRAAIADEKPERPKLLIWNLYQLRLLKGHAADSDFDTKLGTHLKAFGISKSSTITGYGTAIDSVYDQLIREINVISATLKSSLNIN